MKKSWRDCDLVAFDTETSGQYPLTAEICEVAAVKWRNGQVVDEFQALVKPSKVIPDDVIKIHGITNEMVASAPAMSEVLDDFTEFTKDAVLIAHHAAFDLGFIAIEYEKKNQSLPAHPVVCSSLLSRKILPKAPNHRLQTLIPYLGIEQGEAHRALDDSKACLQVAIRCFEKLDGDQTIAQAITAQEKELCWQRFSMLDLTEMERFRILIDAIRSQRLVKIVYSGGSKKGQWRDLETMGLVRSLDGDYLVARSPGDNNKKRFYLNKIQSVKLA